jgi:C4-dicarboxylate-specific signal transduction histidine kinase
LLSSLRLHGGEHGGPIVFMAFVFSELHFFVNRIIRNRIIEKERMKSREKELLQAKEIEKAYNELKATQQQLIQSEKMASLGELTAGIAHEIQNPLNFVNNFSEVNRELIEELKMKNEKLKLMMMK